MCPMLVLFGKLNKVQANRKISRFILLTKGSGMSVVTFADLLRYFDHFIVLLELSVIYLCLLSRLVTVFILFSNLLAT